MHLRPLVFACTLLAASAAAQPFDVGSADDPFERGSAPDGVDGWRGAVWAAPAYLDGWRGAIGAEVDVRAGRVSGALAAVLHPSAGGLYRSEADAWQDALRALAYLRLDPRDGSRVYLRAGPTERLSLGAGALVSRYSATAAPDDRPLGAEGAAEVGPVRVAAFADDVLLGGLVGGEVRWATGRRLGPLARVAATVAGVHDLGPVAGERLTGAELTLRGDWAGDGETFAVAPFGTVAGYAGRGRTLGGGVDAEAMSLGDAVRARARLALFASTAEFVPGFVGPFYRVNGGAARVVVADSFYDTDPAAELAGTPLDSLGSGLDVVLDLRAVVFGRAEVSQYLRRHIGDDRASAYGVRLAGRLPGEIHLELAYEKQGFRGVTGLLFGDASEENRLVLDVGVPVGPVHVFVRSRYGYRRLTPDDLPGVTDDAPRYLIERRFEPLAGVRGRL